MIRVRFFGGGEREGDGLSTGQGRFGDGLGAKRECFGDGFGTYQGRGCLEKRIFPLLWGVRFGSVSVIRFIVES